MEINSLLSCARALQLQCGDAIKVPFSSVSIDSRTLEAGALFIALEGRNYNGHQFLEEVYQKKAVAAITHKPCVSSSLPTLCVQDTQEALGVLAKVHRDHYRLPVIAVTGSCGKTTTKEYLKNIFSRTLNVLVSPKSFNNDIGLPLTLLKLRQQHQALILEIGANAVGEIARLSALAQPTVGIITNIAPAHLEGFGSENTIAREKFQIFSGSRANSMTIVPYHFSQKFKKYLQHLDPFYFGYTADADIYARQIQLDANGRASFTLAARQSKVRVELQVPGEHQIENALAAASAALLSGLSLKNIKLGLEATTSIAGRLSFVKSKRYGHLIDDTYNANPHSLIAALKVLVRQPKPRALVLGDMSELGDRSVYYHRRAGECAKTLGIDQLITYGAVAQYASYAFKTNFHAHNFHELTHLLKNILSPSHTTLFKGSRLMHMDKIVDHLKDR